jgi:hypothetical protein
LAPITEPMAVASKSARSEDAMRAMAGEHFPL